VMIRLRFLVFLPLHRKGKKTRKRRRIITETGKSSIK
jgi:hypothetical protein